MNARALAAELLGTFTLVGLGSLSIVSAGASNGLPPVLVVPFGFGLALLAGIAMFGHISGAHFNPAVTLGALIDGRISWLSALGYVVAQAAGAVAASFMILGLFSKDVVTATRNVPNTQLLSDAQAFAVELVLTTVFVAVILTITRRAPDLAVLVIPLTLTLIHFVAVPITGASVNPARALGPAIVAGNYEHLWIYLSAPFGGSVIGWLIYRFVGQSGEDEEAAESDEVEYLDDDDEDEDEEPVSGR